MLLRRPESRDLQRIDEIWKKHHSTNFGVPNLNNTVTHAVVENEDGKVQAYGTVKLFAEAILYLDWDAPQREKIEALKELMLEAIRGTSDAQLEQLHVFVADPKFSALLKKHFGFKPATGEMLVLEV